MLLKSGDGGVTGHFGEKVSKVKILFCCAYIRKGISMRKGESYVWRGIPHGDTFA
jgi:hypothetical protein